MKMKRLERRRKFHEDIINVLYPPPPSPSSDDEEKEEKTNTFYDKLDVTLIPDPEDSKRNTDTASSSCDDDEVGSQNKLTRAQRKRIRKKKLKDAASRRRKFIGPMLPSDSHNDGGGNADGKEGVRQNDTEERSMLPSDGHNDGGGSAGGKEGVRRNDTEELQSCDECYQVKFEVCSYGVESEAEDVRRNVGKEQCMPNESNLEPPQDMATRKLRRLKQRRMAKKLAKDYSKSSHDEQADGDRN